MIKLREYQDDFVNAVREAMRSHKYILGVAPTGAGKTVIFAFVADAVAKKGKRVIFTVHRQELITQTAKTFDDFGIDYGYICSGVKYDESKLVHIASIDTLKNRLELVLQPDLIMIDETHLCMAAGWLKVIQHFADNGAFVWGNTGSPIRLDGKPLGDVYTTIIEGPTTKWLIDNGHLSQYRYYAPTIPDLSGVKKQMGDYSKNELETEMSRAKLVGDVVHHYKKLANNTRAVCFCVNIKHSELIAKAFNDAGVNAAHIDGTTPKGERKKIINDFADGKIKVLCNTEIVTTGFDLSAQVGRDVPIETCILLRPTHSLALYLQMVGRALRKKDYPAIILDHAACVLKHGLPCDIRQWSLDGNENVKSASETEIAAPVICEECFQAVIKPIPEFCPYCNAVMKKQKAVIKIIEGELQEIKEAERLLLKEKLKQEEREAKTLNEMILVMTKKGSKNPVHAAKMKMQGRAARQARFKR